MGSSFIMTGSGPSSSAAAAQAERDLALDLKPQPHWQAAGSRGETTTFLGTHFVQMTTCKFGLFAAFKRACSSFRNFESVSRLGLAWLCRRRPRFGSAAGCPVALARRQRALTPVAAGPASAGPAAPAGVPLTCLEPHHDFEIDRWLVIAWAGRL